MMAKESKARSMKGKIFVPPLFLIFCSINLQNLLDEMTDAFPKNTHLDSFHHSSKMGGSDVIKINDKYSFTGCMKVREQHFNDRTCN